MYTHHTFLNYVFTCTGCGQCWTMDGNWKITFPHCMYPVEFTIPGLPGISYPDVCQGQPLSTKQAFCRLHQDLAQQKKYSDRCAWIYQVLQRRSRAWCVVVCYSWLCIECIYTIKNPSKHVLYFIQNMLN